VAVVRFRCRRRRKRVVDRVTMVVFGAGIVECGDYLCTM
jgi:hypothetical protein